MVGATTFNGVTLAASLALDTCAGALTVPGDLTLSGGATITISGACGGNALVFNGGGARSLAGSGSVVFGAGGSNASVAVSNNTALSVASGVTVRTGGFGGAVSIGAGSSIANAGTFSAQSANRTLTIAGAGSFSNAGTIEATAASAVLLVSPTTVTNYNAGTFTLTGGTWKAVNGGTLELTGRAIQTIAAGTDVTVAVAAARLRTGGTTSAITGLASVAGSLRLSGFIMSLTPAGGVFDLSGTLTLDPGTVLAVTGNYNQSSTSTLVLNMDAAGDTGKGRITVSGVASVDGALVINFLGQYIQPLCVPSNIFTAQSINGLFSALTLPRDESRIYATTGNSFLLVAQSPADIASAGGSPVPDGFITGEDFDLYIQAFFAELRRPPPENTLIADLVDDVGALPPDGFLTGSDFDYFVLRFFRGCDF